MTTNINDVQKGKKYIFKAHFNMFEAKVLEVRPDLQAVKLDIGFGIWYEFKEIKVLSDKISFKNK